MKTSRKFIFILIICVATTILMLPKSLATEKVFDSADDVYEEAIQSGNGIKYEIEDYHVDMKVRVDNVYDITETIKVNFFGDDNHGIVRSLPCRAVEQRNNGVNTVKRATVSRVSVNAPYMRR